MRIRDATAADRERLRALYEEFVRELPPPPGIPFELEHELAELDAHLAGDGVTLVADDGGEMVGFALAKMDDHPRVGNLSDLYVAPGSRRQGAARDLIRAATQRLRAEGAEVLTLEVQLENDAAREACERLGFRTGALELFAPVDELLERTSERPRGESFGSVHVQSDDVGAVAAAVRKYVPRFGRSAGSVVRLPRNGWTAVYDELADREPQVLRRLATELSYATGAVVVAIGVEQGEVVRYLLLDRGSLVDEYLSVPSYYGELPPGDAIALGANPTVVARLTGADAAQVRAIARTAESPSDLPPAHELVASIGEVMGLSGVGYGYEGALRAGGAEPVSHG
jgi:ribosomal protein S18 acetylase RimI-like enzyme